MSASPSHNSAAVWASAGVTDVGLCRAHNEDALLDRCDLGLWAVADGMGGHERGEVASALLCDGLARVQGDLPLADAVDSVDDVVDDINRQLVAMAATLPGGGIIGSTLVALIARGEFAACVWAGDSRLYRLRNGQLEQMSEDHSLHAQMRARGKEEEPSMSNVITRAVGASAELYLDVDLLELRAHDRYLLCSDGLCNELNPEVLARLLGDGTSAEAARHLVDSARRCGGRDNITAVVADYSPPERRPAT